jgi:hypothetical protein
MMSIHYLLDKHGLQFMKMVFQLLNHKAFNCAGSSALPAASTERAVTCMTPAEIVALSPLVLLFIWIFHRLEQLKT